MIVWNPDDNQNRAREAGAIEIVLEILKKNVGIEYVSLCGCGTLFCLVENNGKSINIWNTFEWLEDS